LQHETQKYKNMIKLINSAPYNAKLKATIQATGKLGFTRDTAEALNLGPTCSVQFAQDENSAKTLYLVVYPDIRPEAFKVNKSGDYLYLSTKLLFDDLKVDYKNKNMMYDLMRMEKEDPEPDAKVYLMTPRYTERHKNQQEAGEE